MHKLGYGPEQIVKIPMMPKGVEHVRSSCARRRCDVKIPMMPKGVEHKVCRNTKTLAEGEDSNDAERR